MAEVNGAGGAGNPMSLLWKLYLESKMPRKTVEVSPDLKQVSINGQVNRAVDLSDGLDADEMAKLGIRWESNLEPLIDKKMDKNAVTGDGIISSDELNKYFEVIDKWARLKYHFTYVKDPKEALSLAANDYSTAIDYSMSDLDGALSRAEQNINSLMPNLDKIKEVSIGGFILSRRSENETFFNKNYLRYIVDHVKTDLQKNLEDHMGEEAESLIRDLCYYEMYLSLTRPIKPGADEGQAGAGAEEAAGSRGASRGSKSAFFDQKKNYYDVYKEFTKAGGATSANMEKLITEFNKMNPQNAQETSEYIALASAHIQCLKDDEKNDEITRVVNLAEQKFNASMKQPGLLQGTKSTLARMMSSLYFAMGSSELNEMKYKEALPYFEKTIGLMNTYRLASLSFGEGKNLPKESIQKIIEETRKALAESQVKETPDSTPAPGRKATETPPAGVQGKASPGTESETPVGGRKQSDYMVSRGKFITVYTKFKKEPNQENLKAVISEFANLKPSLPEDVADFIKLSGAYCECLKEDENFDEFPKVVQEAERKYAEAFKAVQLAGSKKKLNNEMAVLYMNLATLFLMADKTAEAISYYEKAAKFCADKNLTSLQMATGAQIKVDEINKNIAELKASLEKAEKAKSEEAAATEPAGSKPAPGSAAPAAPTPPAKPKILGQAFIKEPIKEGGKTVVPKDVIIDVKEILFEGTERFAIIDYDGGVNYPAKKGLKVNISQLKEFNFPVPVASKPAASKPEAPKVAAPVPKAAQK